MKLRSEVFVVEQNCVYQDLDGRDQNSMHISILHDERIIACARIYVGDMPNVWHVGRVVVRKDWRGKGLGKRIMDESVNYLFGHPGVEMILISAQEYLLDFYSDLGFEPVGKGYMEDGIPHVAMKLNKKKPAANK